METILAAALALLSLMAAGAFAWLRANQSDQWREVKELRQRVADLELGGLRGLSALELKLTTFFGQIDKTLAQILSRVEHLEVNREHFGGRGGQGSRNA